MNVTALAQSAGSEPKPIEVTDFQISVVDVMKMSSGMMMGSGSGNLGMASTSPMTAQAREQKLLFSMKSKNPSASKTVSTVVWEARFLNGKNQEVVKQFKSKKKINPGKDATIEESLSLDTTTLPSSTRFGLRILKVEFSDNSSWEDNERDLESKLTYKTVTFR